MSQHVRHGVIDGVRRVISDIHEICLLDCGNDLLHNVLLDSRHFAKNVQFLGVRNLRV